ncbi:MAG: alpha/beta fold hydrolase [Thermoanaerobaculia bacterium]
MELHAPTAGTASSPPLRRRRWRWILLALAGVVVLGAAVGCSMLSEFQPAIDTPEMRSSGLTSGFVETASGRIHVVRSGLAPGASRVLFVHGSPGTWSAWEGWMENAALRSAARLLAPDRIGFGGSERGTAEPSLARQAASLAAVLEAEPGPPAVVVGHSLGGPIAVRLAMDRPDLVAALLLVAPSIDPALEKHRWYNVAGATLAVQLFLPVDWTTSNRELWPLKRELEAMMPLWRGIDCPTVVVQGEADDLVPAANADLAERQLAHLGDRLEIRRYPGMGHFILWQRPETVTEPLLELLGAGHSGDAGEGGAP